MFTIEEIIKLLEHIKSKHGNLYVGEIIYSEDYPTEILSIAPCVVTNPSEKSKLMVIFD